MGQLSILFNDFSLLIGVQAIIAVRTFKGRGRQGFSLEVSRLEGAGDGNTSRQQRHYSCQTLTEEAAHTRIFQVLPYNSGGFWGLRDSEPVSFQL